MTDKLRPMLAHDLDHINGKAPWGDPAWVMERKYDGIRIVWSNEGGVHYYARSGNDHTGRYDFLGGLALPADTVLDGEIVVPGGVSSDAAALKNRSRLVYVVFDITKMDGHDLRPLPWQERREVLELDLFGCSERVAISEKFEPVQAIADELEEEGAEGVMLKRRRATYREGIRSPDWLKRKAAQEYDCIITDCDSPPTPGSLGDRSGWCVLSYGFYINGALVRCGSVGQSEPREVQERKVGRVAVVKANGMLNVEEGTLRHPRILRFRDDKTAEECTI